MRRGGSDLSIDPKGLERFVQELVTQRTAAELYAMVKPVVVVIEALRQQRGGAAAATQLERGLLERVLLAVSQGARAERTGRRVRAQNKQKAPPIERPAAVGVRARKRR